MSSLPNPPETYDRDYMMALLRTLEQTLAKITQAGQKTYSMQNFVTTRSIDLAEDTQAVINAFLVTAINDLYRRGLLG